MATQVKHRRGTDAEINAGTPAIGELWFNTSDSSIHMGDGATPGGIKHINVNTGNVRYSAVFKNDTFGSAVDNMIAGKISGVNSVIHAVGNVYSMTYGTLWQVESTASAPANTYIDLGGGLGAFPKSSLHVNDFGAIPDGSTDSTNAFAQAEVLREATRLRVLLGVGTYLTNIEINKVFHYEGESTVFTIVKPYNTALPVFTFIDTSGTWTRSKMRNMTWLSDVNGQSTGFQFCKFPYVAGYANTGRVDFENIASVNFKYHIAKLFGNIGNTYKDCSMTFGEYHIFARGSQANGGTDIMHCGDDKIDGGHWQAATKCCFFYSDNTPGFGGVSVTPATTIESNPGCVAYFDLQGAISGTLPQSGILFDNPWLENNGTGGDVSLDTIGGPTVVTPNGKVQSTQTLGYNFNQFRSNGFKHGLPSTNDIANGVNVSEYNGRSAINLEAGEFQTGPDDAVTLSFSSFDTAAIGAWIDSYRSPIDAGTNKRDLRFGAGRPYTTPDVIFQNNQGFTFGHTNSPSDVAAAHSMTVRTENTEGNRILTLSKGGFEMLTVSAGLDFTPNGADAVMKVGRASTGRSINAGGTVNSSGADYAEYMRKNDDCGVIEKGDVCGIDVNGQLTDKYDEAISFCVKSTNPSIVGGDDWFKENPPTQPNNKPVAPVEPSLPEKTGDDKVDAENQAQYEISMKAYSEYVERYPVMVSEWESEIAEYERLHSEWLARMEEAREPFDRIAFCGQVPVNCTAEVGEYLIPINDNGSISVVGCKTPTFEDYTKAVGRVIKVDTHPVIIVKIS